MAILSDPHVYAAAHIGVFTIGVAKETDSNLFSGDDCLLQANSSNNALASCKSFVSKPSVNQP